MTFDGKEENENFHDFLVDNMARSKPEFYIFLGIQYDNKTQKWFNVSTGNNLIYTNFHPKAKRKENENCAVFNLGTIDMINTTYSPGYWHYRNCNDIVDGIACHVHREKSW